MKRTFISDCEGPIGTNDNAFELTAHFIPEGDRIFQILSAYDYTRAVLQKKRGYALGNTTKLVLPFLLAFDASNQSVEEFCSTTLRLLKDSKATLADVQKTSRAFIVSTSYEHYVRALCRETGFPLENTYCTKLNLDEYDLSSKEKAKLRSYAWEIGGMPRISIPLNAKSLQDLSRRDQSTIKRLDKIVWKEIAGMSLKQIFSDIEIATGREKAYAIHDIVHTFSSPLSDVMYVSNDSTDTEAIELVKSGGGLTVSLNGDEAAVRNSEISILSDNNAVIAVLSDLFLRLGKNEALKAAGNWDKDFLWRTSADPAILERLFAVPAEKWPKVRIVSEWNMKLIIDESNAFRKTVQGELSHP